MKKLIILRRASQLVFLTLFIYILWSTTYPLKGLLKPGVFFKIDPLIMLITSISERVLLPGAVFAIGMLALTLILGRFFCGWVCPLGTCIDAAGAFSPRVIPEKDSVNKRLHSIKILLLAIITGFAFFGIQVAWILDPMVISARFVSLVLIPFVTSSVSGIFVFLIRDMGMSGIARDFYHALKGGLLGVKADYFSHAWAVLLFTVLILSSTVFTRRFWCRAICPLGALYALTARSALLKRRVSRCIGCAKCKADCRMGAIKDDISYRQGECVLCMDCVYDCPVHTTYFSFSSRGDLRDKVKQG